jgi:hypothetical protein
MLGNQLQRLNTMQCAVIKSGLELNKGRGTAADTQQVQNHLRDNEKYQDNKFFGTEKNLEPEVKPWSDNKAWKSERNRMLKICFEIPKPEKEESLNYYH